MASSAPASSQPTSAAASENISDILGSIGSSSTDSLSETSSGSESPSPTDPASGSTSAAPTSTAASNTITDAPDLTSGSTAALSSLSDAPSLTSGKPTDLPTLSDHYSYPPPTVPPTQNAPYMQKTNMPENFIFIVVGACIAFVALVIISWRTLTAWSINRRFRRGEGASSHRKPTYTPLADFKQKPPVSSSHDMKDLGSLPKNFSAVPSLFFSPTAEVARHSTRVPSSRDTPHGHLPAGHYRDASRS